MSTPLELFCRFGTPLFYGGDIGVNPDKFTNEMFDLWLYSLKV